MGIAANAVEIASAAKIAKEIFFHID